MTAPGSAGTGRPALFLALAAHLDRHGVPYAVLGNTRELPDVTSDVDLCVSDLAGFERALTQFCEAHGAALVSRVPHSTGIRFNLAFGDGGASRLFPGPDAIRFPAPAPRGGWMPDAAAVLARRCWDSRGFYVASDADAFVTYLAKCALKGVVSPAATGFLGALYARSPDVIAEAVNRAWPAHVAPRILDAMRHGSESGIPVEAIRDGLRPAFDIRRLVWQIGRSVDRLRRPRGLWICFLGPDGSGKSTVIDNVGRELKGLFGLQRRFHLRPPLLAGRGAASESAPVVDPYACPPRGHVGSVVKLAFHALHYLVGVPLHVYPALVRTGLVIFDRYYDDLLADPARYRYGGPEWLARAVGFGMPRPHLYFVLDASPAVLQSRKQEVSEEQSAAQRRAYLRLSKHLERVVVIDTSQPLPAVVDQVNQAILGHLARREAQARP